MSVSPCRLVKRSHFSVSFNHFMKYAIYTVEFPFFRSRPNIPLHMSQHGTPLMMNSLMAGL